LKDDWIEVITNYIPTYENGRTNISTEKAFVLTLCYLGSCEGFRQVADRVGVSLNTAYRCLVRVMDYLLKVLEKNLLNCQLQENQIEMQGNLLM
jgi:hypothetical protein